MLFPTFFISDSLVICSEKNNSEDLNYHTHLEYAHEVIKETIDSLSSLYVVEEHVIKHDSILDKMELKINTDKDFQKHILEAANQHSEIFLLYDVFFLFYSFKKQLAATDGTNAVEYNKKWKYIVNKLNGKKHRDIIEYIKKHILKNSRSKECDTIKHLLKKIREYKKCVIEKTTDHYDYNYNFSEFFKTIKKKNPIKKTPINDDNMGIKEEENDYYDIKIALIKDYVFIERTLVRISNYTTYKELYEKAIPELIVIFNLLNQLQHTSIHNPDFMKMIKNIYYIILENLANYKKETFFSMKKAVCNNLLIFGSVSLKREIGKTQPNIYDIKFYEYSEKCINKVHSIKQELLERIKKDNELCVDEFKKTEKTFVRQKIAKTFSSKVIKFFNTPRSLRKQSVPEDILEKTPEKTNSVERKKTLRRL